MAKKKTKARKPVRKAIKKAPARRALPRERLAAFFRKLYKQPGLMEKFSSSAAGREEVLAKSDLTEEHRQILAAGCMRDILVALSGASETMNTTVSVGVGDEGDGDGDQLRLCNHPDCQAFRTAPK